MWRVGPHLVELGLPRIADELLLVQGVEVCLKAPFLVRLLLERHLPHMADDSLKHSLRQRNAAEVMSVTELCSTLGGRGGEGGVRNEDHPTDLKETSRPIRERA